PACLYVCRLCPCSSFVHAYAPPPDLHSFPTRRSSDLAQGLAAVQQNDLTRALNGVQEKLTRKPADPILLYLQADILAQQGVEPGSSEFERALRSAQKAVILRPTLEPAHSVLGKLYLQAGKYSEA